MNNVVSKYCVYCGEIESTGTRIATYICGFGWCCDLCLSKGSVRYDGTYGTSRDKREITIKEQSDE